MNDLHLDSLVSESNLDHNAQNGAKRWTADWAQQHMVDPAINSALEAVSVFNLNPAGVPREEPAKPDFGSPEWLAETGTKFAVGIVPYVLAGRTTGAVSRAFAEAKGLERTLLGKFAASEMQTQVAGAALYDAAKNPREGETRTGNVLGNALTFGLLGSRLGSEMPVVSLVAKPLLAGALGSSTAQLISQPVDNFNFEKVRDAALTALLIPGVQHGFRKAADGVDHLLGRDIPAPRYAIAHGWKDLASVAETDARLTRVIIKGNQPAVLKEGKTLILPEGSDLEAQRAAFAHDLFGHKANELVLQRQLDKAATLIESDPQAARQQFLDARRADEHFALAQEAKLLGKPAPPEAGAAKPARLDEQHEAQYEREVQAFLASQGLERPTESFGAGGGHGGGGGHHDGPIGGMRIFKRLGLFRQGVGPTERDIPDALTRKFENPSIQTMPGTDKQYVTKEVEELLEKGSDPPTYLYKKVTDIDGTVAVYDKRGIITDFGTADFVEKSPRNHMRYHIIKPLRENPEDIQAGSIYDSYSEGTSSRYGRIHSKETQSDGTVVFRSKHTDQKENFITWEMTDAAAMDYQLGDQSGKWATATLWKDGEKETWLYTAKDGASLFQLPKDEYLSLKIDDKEIHGIRSVFRAADGTTVYADANDNHIQVTPGAGKVLQIKVFTDSETKIDLPQKASKVTEAYANALVVERSPLSAISTDRVQANQVEILPGSTRFNTAASLLEVHTPPKQMPHGLVLRTEYPRLPDSTETANPFDYLQGDAFYQRYSKGNIMDPATALTQETPLGQAYGHWIDAKGNVTYHLRGHDVSTGDPGISWPQHAEHSYPKDFDPPLAISLDKNAPQINKLIRGGVTRVERSLVPGIKDFQPDGSPIETSMSARALYRTSANEQIEVPLGWGGQIFIRRPDGSVIPNTNLGTKLVEDYSSRPQETPFGKATALTLSTDGSVTYSIAGNPHFYEVRQFIIPRATNIGAIHHAKHMADGTWLLMASDSKQYRMNDVQFKTIFGE